MSGFPLSSYLQAFQDIEGWFSFDAAILFAIYNQLSSECAPPGDTLEIGVHHGLSAIAVAALRGADRSFTAIDLFDELQSENRSQSGQGKRELFERNMRRVYSDMSFVHTITTPSAQLSERDIGSDFTFCHIDGGHSRAETFGDLELCWRASRTGGLIAVDDYFNPLYPGVCEGVAQFMLTHAGELTPLAIGFNKVLFQKINGPSPLDKAFPREFPLVNTRPVRMWDTPTRLFESDLRRYFDLRRSTLDRLALLEERGKKATLKANPLKLRTKAGKKCSARVEITNASTIPLPNGAGEFGLSYHLLTHDGRTTVHDNDRVWLTEALAPASTFTTEVAIQAPLIPGRYLVAFDLVWEGVMWFQEAGNAPAYIELDVRK